MSAVHAVPGAFFLSDMFPALASAESAPKVDPGDTAFVLLSAALVMLMTPGLALFYGGIRPPPPPP